MSIKIHNDTDNIQNLKPESSNLGNRITEINQNFSNVETGKVKNNAALSKIRSYQ